MAAKPRARGNGQGTIYFDRTRDRWVAQKYVKTLDGRTRRIIARGRTQSTALDALRRREREVGNASASHGATTVEAFLRAWLEHKRTTVKPRTHREYTQVLEDHVLPNVGMMALSKVRPLHIQRVVDDLARVGKRATAHNCRRYLRSAFAQAVAWEYISRNPMDGVARVEVPTPKRGLWTVEQTSRFLAFARERTRYHPLFLTAVVTGLRQGELVALPWANVTPERVTVDRTWSKDALVGYDTPKTRRAYRTVPISVDVYEAIALGRRRVGGSLAFPSEVGTMALPWNVHRAFVDTIDAFNARDGVEPLPRVRFHDLRRTAATLWARQGAEPKVIQQLMGHATPHLALSIYQGVLDERVDAARLDARRLFGCYAVSHDGQSGVVGDERERVQERSVN